MNAGPFQAHSGSNRHGSTDVCGSSFPRGLLLKRSPSLARLLNQAIDIRLEPESASRVLKKFSLAMSHEAFGQVAVVQLWE